MELSFFTILLPRKRRPSQMNLVDRFYILQVDMIWLDNKMNQENHRCRDWRQRGIPIMSCSSMIMHKKVFEKRERKVYIPMGIENWTIDVESTRKPIILNVSGLCLPRYARSFSHYAFSLSTILSVSFSFYLWNFYSLSLIWNLITNRQTYHFIVFHIFMSLIKKKKKEWNPNSNLFHLLNITTNILLWIFYIMFYIYICIFVFLHFL